MNQSERLELQKSYLAALAKQRESIYPELARRRNLDLTLHTEAVSQIEAIIDLPSMRKKQKLNEIKQILLALRQKQEQEGLT
ncbi:hypothetical protein M5W68_19295 [Paenibacillus larvae]|uniref:hypothetical protein n=1 Tax=Paenibacillus larvae TaxID=1464 RepID=UPI002280BDB9|nr:hypothetical protein [Paenibacillus larvae]MCY9527195.1 hypothetical protein [Paenibacillus larvae]